jgi:Winged helix-turn helix
VGRIPAVNGVVRWRLIDLAQWIFEEFRIAIAKQTLSRELHDMGYRKEREPSSPLRGDRHQRGRPGALGAKTRRLPFRGDDQPRARARRPPRRRFGLGHPTARRASPSSRSASIPANPPNRTSQPAATVRTINVLPSTR